MKKISLCLIVLALTSFAAADSSDVRVTVNGSCGSSFQSLSENDRSIVRDSSIGFFNSIQNTGNLQASYQIDSWITDQPKSSFGAGNQVKSYSSDSFDLSPREEAVYMKDFSTNASTNLRSYYFRSEVKISCDTVSYTDRTKEDQDIKSLYECDSSSSSFECERSVEDQGWEIDHSLSCDSLNSTHSNCTLSKSFLKDIELQELFTVVAGSSDIETGELPIREAKLSLGQNSIKLKRSMWKEVGIEVENTGDLEINDLEINFGNLDGNRWDVRDARIENLSRNQKKSRNLYIKPSKNISPINYSIPVELSYNGTVVDTEYLNIEVEKNVYDYSIEIVDSIGEIVLREGNSEEISIDVRNTGNITLDSLEAALQNFESCGGYSIDEPSQIPINSTRTFDLNIEAGDTSSRCSTTFVVGNSEGAYDFESIPILILPQAGLIAASPCWFPLLVWSILTASFLIMRKNRDFESMESTVILMLMIEIWGLILLYTLINCYYPFLSSLFPSLL